MIKTQIQINWLTPADWDAVKMIYLEGILSGIATFETSLPAWSDWDAKHHPDLRLVARLDNKVVGWAALSPYSSRPVYAGVGEDSIYISEEQRGKGIGSLLLPALIKLSEEKGFWTLQAVIFPENEAIMALHQRNGFRMVGRRERIARLNGIWHDTLLLERRSSLL
jgi:L-amino acid N-acyltransferase YncA